jgi:hypothetical protein
MMGEMDRDSVTGMIDAVITWTAHQSQPIHQYLGLIRVNDDLQRQRIQQLEDRLRTTAQLLIAEVGAAGPESAESAAGRAVAKIQQLTEQVNDFHCRLTENGNHGAALLRLDDLLLNEAEDLGVDALDTAPDSC